MISRIAVLLARSAGLSLTVALLTAGLAFGAAMVMGRRITRAFAPWFLAVMLIPPCVFAQGWIFFFDGIRLPFYGLFGTIWVSVFYYFPLCFALIAYGLQTVDKLEWDAATLTLPPLARFRAVILPQTRHLLVCAGLLTFLLSLGDFSIPSGFQVNVYAMDIYAQFSVRADAAETFRHALPLLVISLGAAALGYSSFRKLLLAQAAPPSEKPRRGGHACAAVTAALTAVPLAALFFSLPAPGTLLLTARDSAGGLFSTFYFGGIAVMLTLPPAFAAAMWLGRHPGRLTYSLIILPLAVPAPLIGIALIAVFIHTPLYATILLLGLGYAVRLTPVAAMACLFMTRSLSRDSANARRVFQRNAISGFLRITLPSYLPALAAGGACVFALSAGETAVTLLLVPPGPSPLSISTYNLLHYGAGDLVAATCFLLLAVCGLVIGAVMGLRYLWLRRFA